jgi:predicted DCC family thiol-disulfide oxidoreductase YuxK
LGETNVRNTTGSTLIRPVLVFDGECEFCKACVRFVARRTSRPLTTVPYQSADLPSLGLTREQCVEAVQWVTTDSVRSGHLAVGATLRHARFPWTVLGAMIGAPGFRRVAAFVYRRVAERRSCAA